MYEEFYGLSSAPFLTVPDPSFLYWTESHAMAFTMLRYGVMTRSQITVVTGEVGAGKTTLVRQLINETSEDVVVGLVSNMQAGKGELLHWVMMAFGQDFDCDNYVRLFKRFQDFVISAYANGKRVTLIVDEAQNLSISALEELRMLSNINADKDELIQIILIGQPQLRAVLARPELEQFAQRISSDFHLGALNAEETIQYIEHRLNVAGARWRIFPAATCELVHQTTQGVPRLINIVCNLCMVYGYAANSKVIDEYLLREFLAGARKRGIFKHLEGIDELPKLVRQAK